MLPSSRLPSSSRRTESQSSRPNPFSGSRCRISFASFNRFGIIFSFVGFRVNQSGQTEVAVRLLPIPPPSFLAKGFARVWRRVGPSSVENMKRSVGLWVSRYCGGGVAAPGARRRFKAIEPCRLYHGPAGKSIRGAHKRVVSRSRKRCTQYQYDYYPALQKKPSGTDSDSGAKNDALRRRGKTLKHKIWMDVNRLPKSVGRDDPARKQQLGNAIMRSKSEWLMDDEKA